MDTKEKILQRACSFFLETNSCKDVTMDKIASSLGISKKTLYENFTNKKNLIYECINHIMNDIFRECVICKNNSENSFDCFFKVSNIIWKHIHSANANFINDIKKYYPEIIATITESHVNFAKQNITKFIDEAVSEGFILPDIDKRFIVNMIGLNMAHASSNKYLRENFFYSKKRIIFLHIYIIIRGISTIKGIEYIDKYISEEQN